MTLARLSRLADLSDPLRPSVLWQFSDSKHQLPQAAELNGHAKITASRGVDT